MNSDQPIGIFDSGIGGLTVLKALHELLPEENLVYLGDTARVPYGSKSAQTVLRYTVRNSLFLLDQNVKAIVLACNTATAFGLSTIQNYFKIPIIGVIEPGAKKALLESTTKKIGVIGTEGTIRSGAYQTLLSRLDPSAQVKAAACPLLVSLVEEGRMSGELVEMAIGQYLKAFQENGKFQIDALILGCTHYPLLKGALKAFVGEGVDLIDSAEETAKTLQEVLKSHRIQSTSNAQGKVTFFSTDAPDRMRDLGEFFWGKKIDQVTKVEIESY